MLLLGSRLRNLPVMSLQTGGELARTNEPVIDPATLSILAYHVEGSLLPRGETVLLRINDTRELSDIGFIIDSIDEFVAPSDVISLDKIYQLQFKILGMSVVDEKRHKLGKIVDYTVDVGTFTIQQLTIKRPLMQSFNDSQLLVHRSQIIEITADAIVVHSKAEVPEHTRMTAPGAYVNPFRKQPTTESSHQED